MVDVAGGSMRNASMTTASAYVTRSCNSPSSPSCAGLAEAGVGTATGLLALAASASASATSLACASGFLHSRYVANANVLAVVSYLRTAS